jgi:hypothetical protein
LDVTFASVFHVLRWHLMAKTLCDWKKHEIVDDIDELMRLVHDPRYVCRKCARVAHSEKHLCKAIPLPLFKWVEGEKVAKGER